MKNLHLIIAFLGLISCKTGNKDSTAVETIPAVTSCTLPIVDDQEWYTKNNKAPVILGLGNLHFPITTTSDSAQFFFDQGLKLSYAFNHAEAARSFYYASRLDTACAMCYWGFAYVLGPNYNAGMEPDNYRRAYDAIQKALSYTHLITNKEKDMIQALSQRYVQDPVDNRVRLDSNYSAAMKILHHQYPDDPEIAALYVESVLDVHPWDLWDKKGNPKSWTPQIVSIIEENLRRYPEHPGLHHFYIHAVEASNKPERGLVSAKKFDGGIVPNAGHLVHMPSHIYIRTGDYHDGSLANIKAFAVDSIYMTTCHAQGAYPLVYFPHNDHFLSATSTLEGKKSWAIPAAFKVRNHVSTQLMANPSWSTLQHYYVIPYFILIKFGEWDTILSMQEHSQLPYPQYMYHYARGYAFIGKNKMDSAKAEFQKMNLLVTDSSLSNMAIWGINKVKDIVQIASLVLSAEIEAKSGQYDESIKQLYQAIALEDALNYQEPPDWFFSVRQILGHVLIDAKKYDEAIKIYKEDLSWIPKNGWSYHGLKKAYQSKEAKNELKKLEPFVIESWKYAEVELDGSIIKGQ